MAETDVAIAAPADDEDPFADLDPEALDAYLSDFLADLALSWQEEHPGKRLPSLAEMRAIALGRVLDPDPED